MSEMQYRSVCINCSEVAEKAYDTLPEAQSKGPVYCAKCGSNMVPTMEIKKRFFCHPSRGCIPDISGPFESGDECRKYCQGKKLEKNE